MAKVQTCYAITLKIDTWISNLDKMYLGSVLGEFRLGL